MYTVQLSVGAFKNMIAMVNHWDLIRDQAQAEDTPRTLEPLMAVLRQLSDLLESMTDAQYVQKPVGVVASSIGGHVRHNLDHIDTLLSGLENGLIDYDARERGTDVECNRHAALAAICRLERQLMNMCWCMQRQSLRLSMLLAADSDPVGVESTLERELAFVLSHTIHHNALIGVMARMLGISVPKHFGYAASTLAYRRNQTCAR